MDRELTGCDQVQNFLEAEDGTVRVVKGAARSEAASDDGEAHRVEERLVLSVEGTVDIDGPPPGRSIRSRQGRLRF